MLRHMVLFTLKPDLKEADRNDIVGKAAALADLESVRRLSIGALLEPREPGYRDHIWGRFEHALLIDFDGEDDLYAYQKDPIHAEFAREIRASAADIKVVDYVVPD